MKDKVVALYMDWATRVAEMSSAVRLHVGCVVVKDDNVISYSWNGTPSGWDNTCEDVVYMHDDGDLLTSAEIELQWPYIDGTGQRYGLVSKPETLHAEMNAIAKLAKSHNSGAGATMFITHSPCIECAKLIYQSGITAVYYQDQYRSLDGINFLTKANVDVVKYDKIREQDERAASRK